MAILDENQQDRDRVISVIEGMANGVNPSRTNATVAHCDKVIRMSVIFLTLNNFNTGVALTQATGTGGGTGGHVFPTNRDLAEAIFRIDEIRTGMLALLNRL